MKCQNCEQEIPPNWVAAISKNKCPGCDGEIMPSEIREIMDEIKEAFGRMANDSEGLAGWIVSNYTLKRKGPEPAQPVEFYRPKEKAPPVIKSAEIPNKTTIKSAQNPLSELTDIVNKINADLYGGDQNEIDPVEEETGMTKEEIKALALEAAKQKGRPLTSVELKMLISGTALTVPMAAGKIPPADLEQVADQVSEIFAEEESQVLKNHRLQRLAEQRARAMNAGPKSGVSVRRAD